MELVFKIHMGDTGQNITVENCVSRYSYSYHRTKYPKKTSPKKNSLNLPEKRESQIVLPKDFHLFINVIV